MKNFVRELTKLFHRWPFCSRVLPPISPQPCPLYVPNCQPLVSLLAARRRTCPARSGLARGPCGTVSWHCRRWVGPSPPGRGLCVWWWCEVGEVWVGGGGGGRCFACQEDNLAELFVNIVNLHKTWTRNILGNIASNMKQIECWVYWDHKPETKSRHGWADRFTASEGLMFGLSLVK